jgi:hypothetical protein
MLKKNYKWRKRQEGQTNDCTAALFSDIFYVPGLVEGTKRYCQYSDMLLAPTSNSSDQSKHKTPACELSLMKKIT